MVSIRPTVFVLALLALSSSGCRRRSSPASGSSAAPAESSPSSAAPAISTTPVPDNIVATAVDTGGPRLEFRIGFVFSPPVIAARAEPTIAVTLPVGSKPRLAYVWDKAGEQWVVSQIVGRDGLITFLKTPSTDGPALPLPEPAAGPASEQQAYTMRMSSIQVGGVTEPPEADGLREENHVLLRQLAKMDALPAVGSEPSGDRNAWLEAQRKQVDQRRDLVSKLAALRGRAANLNIHLQESMTAAFMEAPTNKPEIVAVPASAEVPFGRFLPGFGLSMGNGADSADISFSRIGKSCGLELRDLQVWFRGGNGNRSIEVKPAIGFGLSLQCSGSLKIVEGEDPPTSPDGVSSNQITFGQADTLSAGLPANQQGEHVYTARVFIHSLPSEPWLSSEPLRFRTTYRNSKFAVEWLTDSATVHFAAPAPDPSTTRDLVPMAATRSYRSPGEIREAALGGGGKFVVLACRAAPWVVRVNLETMAPFEIQEIEGDPDKIHIAADQERIFVADHGGRRLRAFSADGSRVLAETVLTPDLAANVLTAGSCSIEGPLLVTSSATLSLWQPATLKPVPIPIRLRDSEPWGLSAAGRMPAWPSWRGSSHTGDLLVLAAPDGCSFHVDRNVGSTDGGHYLLHQIGGRWECDESSILPGWSVGDGLGKGAKKNPGSSGSTQLPTLGLGVLELKHLGFETIPPAPPRITYFSSPDGEALASFAGGMPETGPVEAPANLWFDPVALELITAGRREVLVETLDQAEWQRKAARVPLVVLNHPPPAQRGKTWTFQPRFAVSSAPDLPIRVTSPGVTVTWSQGVLACEVPSDFPGAQMILKLSAGESSSEMTVPVAGLRPARWKGNSPSGDSISIPATTLSLDHQVDSLQVADKGHWLVVSDDLGTAVSVIEMPSRTLRVTRRFADGPGAIVATADALYRWSFTTSVLEKRLLPGLEPAGATVIPCERPMILAAARDERSRPLVAIFNNQERLPTQGSTVASLVLVAPDTLKLSPVKAAEMGAMLWRNGHGVFPSYSLSADGSRVLHADQMLEIARDGSVTHKPLNNLREGLDGSRLSDDGVIAFSMKHAVEIGGEQPWTPPGTSSQQSCDLIPESGSGDFFSISLPEPGSNTLGGSATVVLYSRLGRQVRGTLEDLAEFETRPREALPKDRALSRRVILDAQFRTLITTSPNTRTLVFRPLPEVAFSH